MNEQEILIQEVESKGLDWWVERGEIMTCPKLDP